MGQSPQGILLVSEVYPPAIGGSGVLLENIYSRLDGVPVQVLSHGDAASRVQQGLTVHTIPMDAADWGVRRMTALSRHVRVARRIRQLSSRGDVIHCGRGLPEGLAALLSGRPYVCWTHGEELGYASSSRELTWLMRRVYSHASGLFANSENSARLLRNWGVDQERITVVHPGVDIDRFNPSADPRHFRTTYAPSGETLLLSVGRLQRRKGHDLVLKALSTWPADYPAVRYLIAGDGECRDDLERQSQSLGLGNRVVFLGAASADELPALYAASDIFVLPNRTDGVDFEGFGIVFLEAAATGRPSIGGRSGGVTEAITDGETGVLVSGTDPSELASVLRQLVSSPGDRVRLGAAGRARVTGSFTWELGAHRVAEVHRGAR